VGFLLAVIARIPQDLVNRRKVRNLEREIIDKENRLRNLYTSQSQSPQGEDKGESKT
jgi:hypothetical protein